MGREVSLEEAQLIANLRSRGYAVFPKNSVKAISAQIEIPISPPEPEISRAQLALALSGAIARELLGYIGALSGRWSRERPNSQTLRLSLRVVFPDDDERD